MSLSAVRARLGAGPRILATILGTLPAALLASAGLLRFPRFSVLADNAWCRRGALQHVRAANAIRVPETALRVLLG